MNLLLEILADILKEHRFSVKVLGHDHVGAQYIDAYLHSDGLTRRVSVWGEGRVPGCTRMAIEANLMYPKIDEGEDNVLAHDSVSIEFASPDSIEIFSKFIIKELTPKDPWSSI